MWRRIRVFWASLAGLVVFAAVATATAKPKADEAERKLTAELSAQNAAMADIWEQANRARERGDPGGSSRRRSLRRPRLRERLEARHCV